MTKARRCPAILAAVLALCASANVGCADDPSSSQLPWPPVTRQTRPWTRWWWMGSIVNESDLTAEMEKYAQAGIGGLEITPIYGVKGYEDRFINYLTPEWMKMLEFTLKEADRLSVGIDMATGNGWPFGGPWVGAEDACKNVVYKTFTLRAGESLSEPVAYAQRPMVRAIGRRLSISELKEPVSANEDLQSLALEQVRFEKSLPLQVLMAYSDQRQALDLTDRVDETGKLDWTAPAGNWTLYAVFQGWHGKMVERAGPGGEGNVIDHFSREALRHYLSEFDRAYTRYDVGSLRAYFNDSYEVDDASGESNWTPRFFDEFERRRGYDLREHLPALFGKDSQEKNARILCDYRETISDLLLDEFTIPWRQWAESKGATTRNQAHGSPANLLDLYAASGIPETEGSDFLGFKIASSGAHVTGKSLTSCEAATWMDEHFQGTPAEAKRWADRYFLGGVNHICYHGTTFSPPGEAWPGWMFYASVHFGPTNSFWRDFAALNRYVTRCQSFLQAGTPDNDVLLYFPIHDQWSQPGRSMLSHFRASMVGTAADAGETLRRAGYTFDFISDRQLAGVKYAAGTLQTGGVSYKTVVVPPTELIPLSTFARLLDLARQGATVVVQGKLPSDVPGWRGLDERRAAYRKLLGWLEFADVADSAIRSAPVGSGRFLLGDSLEQLLATAGVAREPMVEQGLQFVRRTLDGDRCYYVLNSSSDALDGWVPLQGPATSVALYDPMREENGLGAVRETDGNATEVYLQLAPGESCILRTFDTVVSGPAYHYFGTAGPSRQIEGTWTVTLIEGGPQLLPAFEIEKLGSWTDYGPEALKSFSGTARYTIAFAQPEGDPVGWYLDLGRVCESAGVKLNGDHLGTLIGPPFRIVISSDQMHAQNTLEVEVSNLMANRIADMDRRGVVYKKFYNANFPARLAANRGADGLFNASRWSPRDSGLIGPVVLAPVERKAFDPQSDGRP
ncbi:MAG: hypothetical protein JW955_19410 [Sedimentisphaerales bacterium]|nr:hypothetical protein [Sedimentisphaerales bacterium]